MRFAARLKRSRHGLFYFRLLIPKALRPLFGGRREVAASLGTSERQSAILVAHTLSAQALVTFAALKSAMANDSDDNKSGKTAPESFSLIRKWELEISPQNGIRIKTDPNSPQDHARAMEMLKELGKIGLVKAIQGQPAAQTTHDASMPLEASIKRYIAANRARWSAKTFSEYDSIFTRFKAFVGGRHVHHVTSKTISDYLASLVEVGIGARTRDKHLMVLKRYFDHTISTEEYRGKNPTTGQSVFSSTERKRLKGWEPFDDKDLAAIFNPVNYASLAKPHEFWFPVLGLFTGARIAEIAQLGLSDVGEEDGIPCLSINDEDGRNVKTDAAIRRIPIHPVLLQMGFLDYVNDVRKIPGAQRVFPYLRRDAFGSYADVPGEAFRRYLNSLSVSEKPKRVFHSFRKSANNTLKQGGVSEEHRCAMIGHAHETVNSATYGQPLGVAFLTEHVVPKLVFPGLDFAALRYTPGQFDTVLRREMERRDGLLPVLP